MPTGSQLDKVLLAREGALIMTQPPSKLTDLRDEIDALDDALLDLIERRMLVATKVAALKGDDGYLKLRPKRESAIVARLAGRASVATPVLIAHVWREMMAHSRQSQASMSVQLFAPTAPALIRERAREQFGRVTPIIAAESPATALEAAAAGEAVAVIEVGDEPWWLALPDGLVMFGLVGDEQHQAILVGRLAEADVSDEQRTAVAARLAEAGR